MKKIMSLIVIASMIFSCVNIYAANVDNNLTIPTKMNPNTILTYNEDLSVEIVKAKNNKKRDNMQYSSKNASSEFVDHKGRDAEDTFCNKIKEDAKKLPHYAIETELPKPVAGMSVIYGTDGRINHILNADGSDAIVLRSKKKPGVGERAEPGVYTYGDNDNTIMIIDKHVLGEGRFTVFRAGVGGSNEEGRGSSGKILGTGDVATKWEYDNPNHNTAVQARALDTDIKKTVYKNDIGSLPDAVLDIYFWGWDDKYFGYKYSDTLSFSGRYYYEF